MNRFFKHSIGAFQTITALSLYRAESKKPQEKGKVESGIKFIKDNFFKARTFSSNLELRSSLDIWLTGKCNGRVHGTTRKIPHELFTSHESHQLLSLPKKPFSMPIVATREVYKDCHIYVDYSYYSVPYEYVGKTVEINITKNVVKISYNGMQIAVHELAQNKGDFKTNESHYPRYKYIAGTDYQKLYQNKMAQIGVSAEELFFKLVKEQKNSWQQTVKGILSLTKTYSHDVIELSCKRALHYGATKYSNIKSICSSGFYNLPLNNDMEINK